MLLYRMQFHRFDYTGGFGGRDCAGNSVQTGTLHAGLEFDKGLPRELSLDHSKKRKSDPLTAIVVGVQIGIAASHCNSEGAFMRDWK